MLQDALNNFHIINIKQSINTTNKESSILSIETNLQNKTETNINNIKSSSDSSRKYKKKDLCHFKYNIKALSNYKLN